MYSIIVPHNGNFIEIQYNANSIHIVDSYKVKRKRDMKQILMLVRYASYNRGIFYAQNNIFWIIQWKINNFLYSLGKSSRKDIKLKEKKK